MLTLELLHTGLDYSDSMNMTQVVQKRLDYIRYSTRVPYNGVGVEFLGWDEVDANDYLNISDLSASIPENASLVFDDGITVTSGSIINVETKNVLVTDQVTTNNDGTVNPLFYHHKLSVAAAENSVSVQAARWDGQIVIVDPIHFVLGTSGRYVFTDLKNSFDEKTGRYTVYYVQWLDEDGTSHEEILNSFNAYNEATIDDIDPDTGLLYADAPAYWVAGSEPNLVFSFSGFSTWYVKQSRDAQITVLPPTLTTINDPWFLGITNGYFEATIDGTLHTYEVTEFTNQNFTPTSPYLRANYELAKKISPALIKLQREHLYVESSIQANLEIVLVDKTTGDIEYAFTTDPTLIGTLYANSLITYTDTILDWDEPTGIVRLSENLVADKYEIRASYNYEAKSYELNTLNLNPFLNPGILDHQIIVYLQPDNSTGEHSIWYLLVQDNIIVFASQPEFAEVDENGNWNPNTIVGFQYTGEGGSGIQVFTEVYAELLVLADIFVSCGAGRPKLELDCRVPGGGVDLDWEEAAVRANPRTSYLPGMAPINGYPWPRFGLNHVRVPYTLHEDFGGELTDSQIRDLVQKHMSAGEYAIIRFDGVIPEWGCGSGELHPLSDTYRGLFNDTSGQTRLNWFKEDPDYRFKIYRANTIDGVYSLIATVAGETSGDCNEYIDTTVTIGNTYYYYIRALSPSDIEGPASQAQGIKVY